MMMQEVPLGAGGETIITDMRAVTADLEQQGIVRFFDDHGGVRYVKTFWSLEHVSKSMSGLTWQSCYGGTKAEVEAMLAASGVEWSWHDEDILQVINTEPVLRPHPLLPDTLLWFNG